MKYPKTPPPMAGTQVMSAEDGERFVACVQAITDLEESFRKQLDSPKSIFEAASMSLVATMIFFDKNMEEIPGKNEQTRKAMHALVDRAFVQFEYSKKLYALIGRG